MHYRKCADITNKRTMNTDNNINQSMAECPNNYCVILAGGKGQRLWPASTEDEPKQFIDIFGLGRTQLQQTYDRFRLMMPSTNIYVCTKTAYRGFVEEQLPELPKQNILVEPISRGTAPSVLRAVHTIGEVNANANVVVTPSDQMVLRDKDFCKNIGDSFAFAEMYDRLLVLGAIPTSPNTEYGYIQMGDEVMAKAEGRTSIYGVKTFTEKPDAAFSEMFLKSEEFLWNTGMVAGNVRYFKEVFDVLLPYEEDFSRYPNMQLDRGILEKVDGVCVMQCHFGWTDVGTWSSVYGHSVRRKHDNLILNRKPEATDIFAEHCTDNVISIDSCKVAVLEGLEGYVIAEKDGMLLVCPKDRSVKLIRKYMNSRSS